MKVNERTIIKELGKKDSNLGKMRKRMETTVY